MKRWLIFPVLVVGALALTAIGLADPGHGNKNKPNAKGGKLVFHVTTTDHGCNFRPWATDTLRRVYKVRRNHDGSYTVRSRATDNATNVETPGTGNTFAVDTSFPTVLSITRVTSTPTNAAPFTALPETQDLLAKNPSSGKLAAQSARLDFRHLDAVPQRKLDALLWKSVHGADSTPPPPGPNAVRGHDADG